MHYLETEFEDNHIRLSWNGSGTFNVQFAVGGEWVDVECFTCYGFDNADDAFEWGLDWVKHYMVEED